MHAHKHDRLGRLEEMSLFESFLIAGCITSVIDQLNHRAFSRASSSFCRSLSCPSPLFSWCSFYNYVYYPTPRSLFFSTYTSSLLLLFLLFILILLFFLLFVPVF